MVVVVVTIAAIVGGAIGGALSNRSSSKDSKLMSDRRATGTKRAHIYDSRFQYSKWLNQSLGERREAIHY